MASLQMVKRPAPGKQGRAIKLYANFFAVKVQEGKVYQYDIAFQPEMPSPAGRRLAFACLFEQHQKVFKLPPPYDGDKTFYLLENICTDLKVRTLPITLPSKREGDEPRIIDAQIRMVATVERKGAPKEALRHYEVLMRNSLAGKPGYVGIRRSFFTRGQDPPNLGFGVELWRGFFQHVRNTQLGLMLNYDVANCSFFQPINLIEFSWYCMGRAQFDMREIQAHGPLNRAQILAIEKETRNIKIQLIHLGDQKRTCFGLTAEPANKLKFNHKESGKDYIVSEYFKDKYKKPLTFPHFPCVKLHKEKPIFIPMELCLISPGQWYRKKLNPMQTQEMIRATAQKPHERKRTIEEGLRNSQFDTNPLLKHFGFSIDKRMAQVTGRVLPAPVIQYSQSGGKKTISAEKGAWKPNDTQLAQPVGLATWAVLSFAGTQLGQQEITNFVQDMLQCAKLNGYPIQPPKLVKPARSADVEKEIAAIAAQKAQFVLCILSPKSDELFAALRKLCDSTYGIHHMVCVVPKIRKHDLTYCLNLLYKINSKLGGTNFHVQENLPLFDRPTMVVGIDVTHPPPGMGAIRPSIAAVVASMNIKATQYVARVALQGSRIEHMEKLKDVMKDLIITFAQKNNQPPTRIIVYRDGVSDDQFQLVMDREVAAIKATIQELAATKPFTPVLSYIVIQKRHHARLFAEDSRSDADTDRSGNVVAGSVLDTGVVDPQTWDFYLMSHGGIQGTSRPSKYNVLYDEGGMSPDAIQRLSYALCHHYARCNRSVSVIPPVYYADIVAERTRFYLDHYDSESDTASQASGAGAPQPRSRFETAMAQVHPNLRNSMYWI
eukprot:TRINITY_DN18534_c0_g1::TRINITY_DN18534_c0_g1_i1::g.1079::m.1079 TRINITY_DN18534_c0_g1::TRINITY_DN18534_c0_g1_i1::g.1079  ORF type:complete len:831 (+),score=132.82,sp/Q8CJG0/AGO2_MOUSE/35.61/6e-146,Piwi/PF02171.12/6.8e-81,PAZ/PF02170.17/4.9e-19,PAZ/PF02170.17/4.1e+03,DUF1785/PF08699.5/1.1e-14 TRINITY_DN18534_c0_g1_i1:94-2586(+)